MLAAEYLKLNKSRDAVDHARIALKDPRFIYPERAHSVIGRAALSRDPHAAVRSLERSLTYQPWVETVMKLEYETLARVLRNAGSEERADEILEELKNLLASDTRD
jgi:hypothetical protein